MHISLAKKSGLNELRVPIAEDQAGKEQWTERRLKPFAPAFRNTRDSDDSPDPTIEMRFDQRRWIHGGNHPLIRPESDESYDLSTFDASCCSLRRGYPRNYGSDRGNDMEPIGVCIPNPFFEMPEAKGQWSDVGSPDTTTLAATTAPRTTLFGSQHALITGDANGDGIKYAVNDAVPYRGKSITFSAYLRVATAPGGGEGGLVRVTDSAGNTASSVVSGTSYAIATVTRTVDAGATSLEFSIELSTATSVTVYADDLTVYSGNDLSPSNIVEFGGDIYQAFGRMICKLKTDTTDEFVWEPVFIHASQSCTSLAVYDGFIYAAFNGAATYEHSSDGSTWTTATGTAGLDTPKFFTVSRGDLWASDNTQVYKDNVALGAVVERDDWTTAFSVGDNEEQITSLFDFQDTLFVGKEDGLFSFVRSDSAGAVNEFVNQTKMFENAPSSTNFSRYGDTGDEVWVKTGHTGLLRISGGVKSVQNRLFGKAALGLPGRIRSFAASKDGMFIFHDDRLSRLVNHQDEGGGIVPHTVQPPSVSIDGLVAGSAFSTDTGAVAPDTQTQTGSGTSFVNPERIEVDDDSWTVADSGALGKVLKAALLKAGSATGNTKTDTSQNASVGDTLGGSADLWGATLTPADVNASDFGVRIWGDDLVSQTTKNLDCTGLSFSVPTDATILGVEVLVQWQGKRAGDTFTGAFNMDYVTVKVYYEQPPVSSDGIGVDQSEVVTWAVSSVERPHLLGTVYGIESTDSEPYAFTDCWALPLNSAYPDLDDSPAGLANCFFQTATIDFGRPGMDKAVDSVSLKFVGIDADQTVKVRLAKDGADPATAPIIATITSSEQFHTLYTADMADPEQDATGREFKLYISGEDLKEDFEIQSFTIRAHVRKQRRRIWNVAVILGGATQYGMSDPAGLTNQKDDLDALEFSDFPLTLTEDSRGEGIESSHTVTIVPDSVERAPELEAHNGEEAQVWRFQLLEHVTS